MANGKILFLGDIKGTDKLILVLDTGFIYPVFSNGAIDDSHAMVYTKKDLHSDPQKGYWEDMFCQNKGIYGC